jgi:hypothetical protein
MGLNCNVFYTHRPHTATNQDDCKDSPDEPQMQYFYTYRPHANTNQDGKDSPDGLPICFVLHVTGPHVHETRLQGLTRCASNVCFYLYRPPRTRNQTENKKWVYFKNILDAARRAKTERQTRTSNVVLVQTWGPHGHEAKLKSKKC